MNTHYSSDILRFENEKYLIRAGTTMAGKKLIIMAQSSDNPGRENFQNKIEFDPLLLNEVIESLLECRTELRKLGLKLYSSPKVDKQEICKRYLKGISIKDLCIQFDKSSTFIEKVLIESNITIVGSKWNTSGYTVRKSRFSKRK